MFTNKPQRYEACTMLAIVEPSTDHLSSQIERVYQMKKQKPYTRQVKAEFCRSLKSHLMYSNIYTLSRPVYIMLKGSSATEALALDDSDLDICVKTSEPLECSVLTALKSMRSIYDLDDILTVPRVIGRKHPILHFLIEHPINNHIKVDLQMHSKESMRGTHLVANYIRGDDRFPKLALILKLWARKYEIDGTQKGLSSYALCIMLIHYLHEGCGEAVLPCLHEIFPDVFHSDSDPDELRDFRYGAPYLLNNDSLGDLLIGFFRYFNRFNFSERVVTIAKCRGGYKSYVGSNVHIEEPFKRVNLVKLDQNGQMSRRIKDALRLGHRDLMSRRNLNDIISL